ncbi:hypothetical protein WJX73_009350 [Symbiochloris irregularis]|uniref:Sperm-associated antigen 6 n=1 Tax=Symbiochloris irregularis TaxID=706552 RepID=A0AAW1NVJ0_9CHLO
MFDPQGTASAVEMYKQARLSFVETVLELAKSPQNVENLARLDVVTLLRPLLADTNSSVQLGAATALGRLAGHRQDVALCVGQSVTLSHLVQLLTIGDTPLQCAAAYLLRSVAKHSEACASAVAEAGAVIPLVEGLEGGAAAGAAAEDGGLPESCAWTLGYLAKHSISVAEEIAVSGGIAPLVECLKAAATAQQRVVFASALGDVSKHSPELAQAVVDAGAVGLLTHLAAGDETRAARQACMALAAILQHGLPQLAASVAQASVQQAPTQAAAAEPKGDGVLPDVLVRKVAAAGEGDDGLRMEACAVLCELLKWLPEDHATVLGDKGLTALTAFIKESRGSTRLPAVKAVGIAGGASIESSEILIAAGVMAALVAALKDDPEVPTQAAAAAAIAGLAGHSAQSSRAAIDAGAVAALLGPAATPRVDAELAFRARSALKALVQHMDSAAELDALLRSPLPEGVLLMVLQKLPAALADESAQQAFHASGALAMIQPLSLNPNTVFKSMVAAINAVFPEQLVLKYDSSYSPDESSSCAMQPESSGAAGLGVPSRLRKKRVSLTKTSPSRGPIKQSSIASSVAESSAAPPSEAVQAPTGTIIKTPSGLSQYAKSASAHYTHEKVSHGEAMRKFRSSKESAGKEEYGSAGPNHEGQWMAGEGAVAPADAVDAARRNSLWSNSGRSSYGTAGLFAASEGQADLVPGALTHADDDASGQDPSFTGAHIDAAGGLWGGDSGLAPIPENTSILSPEGSQSGAIAVA